MTALVTAALTLIALVLQMVASWKTERQKRYDEIQQGRKDIASGNTVAVDNRVDRVLSVSGVSTTDAGEQSAEDIERRISKL